MVENYLRCKSTCLNMSRLFKVCLALCANKIRYLEAANLNKTLGHSEDALSCAEKGLKVDEECLGVDNPMYQDTLEIVEEIRSSI